MCDACSAAGRNWSLANGPQRNKLVKAKIFSAFSGREIKVKLCYLCSIKLFISGEKTFLQDNPIFNVELSNQHAGSEFDF